MNLLVRRPARGRALLATLVAVVLALGAVVVGGSGHQRAQASDGGVLGVFGVAGWRASDHTLRVGSLQRAYLVAEPVGRAPGERLPVVVLLHGRGMTPARVAAVSGLLGAERALVVLPAGYKRSWDAGFCCAAARAAHVDDVAFLSRVVADVLAARPDADPARVFLVGFSNGGRMAYRMACRRPGLFAGVAAVEAVTVDPCPGVAVAVPLLVVAVTADPLLRQTAASPRRVLEGYAQPSVDETVAAWRRLDGCGPTAPDERSGLLLARRWVACRDGANVELDRYTGVGHVWPAGAPLTPSAQDRIWRFFRAARPVI